MGIATPTSSPVSAAIHRSSSSSPSSPSSPRQHHQQQRNRRRRHGGRLSGGLGIFLVGVVCFSLTSLWFGTYLINHVAVVDDVESRNNGGGGRSHGSNKIDRPVTGMLIHPSTRSSTKSMLDTGTTTAAAAASTHDAPIKIAHVISLVTCHKANRVRGFVDALAILRQSIHENSVHATVVAPAAGTTTTRRTSKYSYQMYAVIHEDGGCDGQIPLLNQLGYIPLVRQTPVNISSITTNDWYRDHVESENCCGSKEFIKLYAYTLTSHPVVVHWDLDVAVLQPMDDLFDAIIYDKDSPEGQAARRRLQIQRPHSQTLPDQIDAFFTRDVTSAEPDEPVQAVQGGFVVARPSLEHFQMYQEFIHEANYTGKPLRGPGSGWGGMGYGGFQGAMAYQGVLAYFYDVIYPHHSVHLDVCRWNQVVADVIWRGPKKKQYMHQCRDYPEPGTPFESNTPERGQCEDCRVLPVEETMTAHYTACKKPWECLIPTPRNPRNKEQIYRLQELTNITTCGLLFKKYFEFRRNLEEAMVKKQPSFPVSTRDGPFHPEYFLGYCKSSGGYVTMKEMPADFDMKQIYGF